MLTYEQKLSQSADRGFREASMHFEENSAVHKSLRRITRRLTELNIPHAVVGGMAMYFHGFRRFTEDVDLLVTPQGLAELHKQLDGLGYVPPFKGSKQLRDAETGVRIEFLVTGQFPGDGKPKPVSFPDPAAVATEINGIQFISLPTIFELKLASGMTNPGRFKDLGDVQELIRTLKIDRAFGNQLNPYVREKFLEMWDGVQHDLPPE